MDDLRNRIARALLDINAVGFSPDKPLKFKSGILSPVYVDNRCLPYYPAQWHMVIEGFQVLIESDNLTYDVLAGVAVGGIPHSSALAYTLHRPSVFVRKETKEHGTQKQVEGGSIEGRHVLLVEDLVTTGGSSLNGIAALRTEGAIVNDVLAVVSYGFEEAQQAFDQVGVRLHTLTNFAAIVEQAAQLGSLGQADVALIQNWLQDPHGWTNP